MIKEQEFAGLPGKNLVGKGEADAAAGSGQTVFPATYSIALAESRMRLGKSRSRTQRSLASSSKVVLAPHYTVLCDETASGAPQGRGRRAAWKLETNPGQGAF